MLFRARRFDLNYEFWGDPEARPILLFHGFPGTSVQARPLVPFLEKHGACLIAVDRPGYGGTKGQGMPIEFLDDLRVLLDQYKFEAFTVLGVSGGASWAHLMASRFSDEVEALGIVCGLSPFNRETKTFFSRFQSRALALRRVLPTRAAEAIVNGALKGFNPEARLEAFARLLHAVDQAVLVHPALREMILASMEAARVQGARGILYDAALFQGDWLKNHCDRARLNQIPTFYFHGKQDKLLDHRMSEWMHAQHPNARIRFFDDEGHYSLAFTQIEEILTAVLAATSQPPAIHP